MFSLFCFHLTIVAFTVGLQPQMINAYSWSAALSTIDQMLNRFHISSPFRGDALPFDAFEVSDASNAYDESNVFTEFDAFDVSDAFNAYDEFNVFAEFDAFEVSDAFNAYNEFQTNFKLCLRIRGTFCLHIARPIK